MTRALKDGFWSHKAMKKRVLIVEDDAAVRDSMKKVLEAAGFGVEAAADGQEAVVGFVPEEVDLVLLDLNLPFLSGWDVFERLTTKYPLVPIIIITGRPRQFPTALAAGVGALIEKPNEVPMLLKTIDQVLAEPPEARLRRMCGYEENTRYAPAPTERTGGQRSHHATKAHAQLQSSSAARAPRK